MKLSLCRLPRILQIIFVLLNLIPFFAEASVRAETRKGVIIVGVESDGVAKKAGIQQGDRILSWERHEDAPANPGQEKGEIDGCFDLQWIEQEQAPRGRVTLIGVREGKEFSIPLAFGSWKLSCAPDMPQDLLTRYETARKLVETKQITEGINFWKEIIGDGESTMDRSAACWLWLELGSALVQKNEWAQASTVHAQAEESCANLNSPYIKGVLLQRIAIGFERNNELILAGEMLHKTHDIYAAEFPDSLVLAQNLNAIGELQRKSGDIAAAEKSHKKALALQEKNSPQKLNVAATFVGLAILSWKKGDLNAYEMYHRQALSIRETLAPGSILVANSYNSLGVLAKSRGDLDSAESLQKKALAILEKEAPDSVHAADTYSNLAMNAQERGSYDKAEELYKRALSIHEKLEPESVQVAKGYNNLGVNAYYRGDLKTAEDFYRRALAIREKLPSEIVDVAGDYQNLAGVAYRQGKLDLAEKLFREALQIFEKHAPDSLDVALVSNNLGAVVHSRGDLASAEELYNRGLIIRKKQSPDSLDVARSLNNLGILARDKNDLVAAEQFYSQSLAIREKKAPGSIAVAKSYSNLAVIAADQLDFEKSEMLIRKSLAINKVIAPMGWDVAIDYANLGINFYEKGDYARADEFLTKSLLLRDELSPGSLESAKSLHALGALKTKQKDLTSAEDFLTRAITIIQRYAPESTQEAETLFELGVLFEETKKPEQACEYFRSAIESLEAQRSRIGGSQQSKSGFLTRHKRYYLQTIDCLRKFGRHAEAFHFLERSRARSLLDMLAEKDLFLQNIPHELEAERKSIDFQYDDVQATLYDLSPSKDKEKLESLLMKMKDLRLQQNDISEKIRKSFPLYASLKYPQPLKLAEAQQILDPGTLFLSFSLGKEQSTLFAVTRESFQVYNLSVGEETLQAKVNLFRKALETPVHLSAEAKQAGFNLYKILLTPVEDLISKSERILVAPEGPLHSLPFGALIRSVDDSNHNSEYLIAWKPTHSVVSATVYAELQKGRKKTTTDEKEMIAFGDPVYPVGEKSKGSNNSVIRSLETRGIHLSPLPSSRKEVEDITKTHGAGARAFLGHDATEELAKSAIQSASYIHFACHGILNERFPLDSALALTIPDSIAEGKDNGFLQAWEIFEQVRLDADLVVLSACKTGLGKDLGGEGLVGLTRAFQYAGARSVMATLWSIADQTTAPFMEHFYRNLKSGKSKDDALRIAQLEFIKNPVFIENDEGNKVKFDASAPFFWAAFQLNGDWR